MKTTEASLLNFFSFLCMHLTNDLVVLCTTVHFCFSGDFTHTLLHSGDEVDTHFLKELKNNKQQQKLATSLYTFPLSPWVCLLQMRGTASIHCASNESRCVLPESPVVKDFVGNHTDYPLCQGTAATVLWKKCCPEP